MRWSGLAVATWVCDIGVASAWSCKRSTLGRCVFAVSLLCLCAYGIRPGMYVWHALTSGHVRGWWRGQVEKEKAAAKEEEMKKRIEIKETRLASVESRLAVCASPLPPRPPASLCHGTDPARAYVGHGCKGMGGSSGGQARASGCTL